MNIYRSDYTNQVHQLIVSVSKHFYILKSGDLMHRRKPMEIKLPKIEQSPREHIVHYLIRDHFSGAFYAEMCSARAMMPLEEFLYRAWSKKESYRSVGVFLRRGLPGNPGAGSADSNSVERSLRTATDSHLPLLSWRADFDGWRGYRDDGNDYAAGRQTYGFAANFRREAGRGARGKVKRERERLRV